MTRSLARSWIRAAKSYDRAAPMRPTMCPQSMLALLARPSCRPRYISPQDPGYPPIDSGARWPLPIATPETYRGGISRTPHRHRHAMSVQPLAARLVGEEKTRRTLPWLHSPIRPDRAPHADRRLLGEIRVRMTQVV